MNICLVKSFALISIILAQSFSYSAWAQNSRTITGKVVDQEGMPIPGVNVTVKDTSRGTITDQGGHFIISARDGDVLVFSFIGFSAFEVAIRNELTLLNVTLLEDAIYCGPPVSIGYGVTKHQQLPLAISFLSNKDFNQGLINDPSLLWQGKVPGLSIYNRGGDPNGETFLRIRGMTSFDVVSRPLIVIDGVPAASLNNLDPNDVESITVLKDGSSSAIYGLRGSAGVIEVTTRRSAPGVGLSVTYHNYLSASIVQRKWPLLSPAEFINAGGVDAGSSTDWQDQITRAGFSAVNAISIGGASGHTTFRASLNFRNIEGILLYSGYDQINGRFSLTHRALQGRLRIDFNLAFTSRESDFSFPEAFRYIYYNPTAPIRFPNGNFYQAILFDNYNPVALLELNTNSGNRKTNNFNTKASYSISDNLIATVHYAQQFEDKATATYYSRQDFTRGLRRGGLAQQYQEQTAFTLIESYLNYFRNFGRTDFSALIGHSFQQDQFDNLVVELGNFPSDELGLSALETSGDRLTGNPNLVNITSAANPVHKLNGTFSRVTIIHNKVWSMNLSLRRESSNRIGGNKKAGIFSSMALGADLNKLFQLDLNILKARIGYGVTGAIPSQPNLHLDLFEYQFINGGRVVQTQKANPDLRWEQKKEVNMGVDFGLGKVFGSIDYFNRRIKDIIQRQQIIDVQAYSQYQNSGGLKGRGIELSLNYSLGNNNSFQWTPGLFISVNRTFVNRFKDEYQFQNYSRGTIDGGSCGCSGVIRWGENEKVAQFWAPIFDGVTPNGTVNLKDLNGDGRIDALSDYASAGSAIPSLELGWTNLLKYRQWDLNAFIRGTFGHSLLNVPRLLHEPDNIGSINTWNQVRTDKAIRGVVSTSYNSAYIERADFLKLDNVTVGYNFKGHQNVRGFKIQASIQNAFVITNYTGVDPEPIFIDGLQSAVYSISSSTLSPGIDRKGGYFPARTFTLGITLGL